MKKTGKYSLALIGWLALSIMIQGLAFGEDKPSSEKIRDIHKLLEVSGIRDQMDYMKDNVLSPHSRMISISYPKVPDTFWEEFNALVGPEEMDALMARVVQVYDKQMSHTVIKQLIEMFSTPFWEEWKQKMPGISREAGLAGSQWAQDLLQSGTFQKKIDDLIQKHNLEKINTEKKP